MTRDCFAAGTAVVELVVVKEICRKGFEKKESAGVGGLVAEQLRKETSGRRMDLRRWMGYA